MIWDVETTFGEIFAAFVDYTVSGMLQLGCDKHSAGPVIISDDCAHFV